MRRKSKKESLLSKAISFLAKWMSVGMIFSMIVFHWVAIYSLGRWSAATEISNLYVCESLYEDYHSNRNRFTIRGCIKDSNILEEIKRDCPDTYERILTENKNNIL